MSVFFCVVGEDCDWDLVGAMPLLVGSSRTRSVVCLSSFVVVLWQWGCHCVWM